MLLKKRDWGKRRKELKNCCFPLLTLESVSTAEQHLINLSIGLMKCPPTLLTDCIQLVFLHCFVLFCVLIRNSLIILGMLRQTSSF